MARRKQLPLVAICGRPNVGKSTLYNRILGQQRAIIHDQEGITRDRHFGTANYDGHRFQIVDTGGLVEAPLDPVLRKMQEQVRLALNEAEVVIFVVDGREELTRTDFELRDELFKLGKPVVLAVNKLDNAQLQQAKTEFYELGLGDPIAVSSTHGLGIEQLMDAVVSHLPETHGEQETAEASEERQAVFVAIVGKPNVGKSSLVNALLKEERLIVHEEPGTTRDAIDIEFAWRGRQYVLIDTAGMRKKAGIDEEIEYYSVSRSLRAVRRGDVCLVLIDAAEGITEQDKRILGYIEEQGKSAILVYTKWDLVEDKQERLKRLREERTFKIPYFSYMPSTTVSSVTGQRIFKLFELIDRVNSEAEKRIPTAELNAFIKDVQAAHKAPGSKGKYAKILYATQASVKPTTFVLFVNQKRLFHFSYLRYLDNRLRERYAFEGVPIRLQLREGKPQQ